MNKAISDIICDRYHLLVDAGYNVIYVGLYGSQNYGLSSIESDVDLIAVVDRSISSIIKGESISREIKYDNGHTVVKDLISFAKLLQKGAPNYVECSHSNYWKGDELFKCVIGDSVYSLKAIKGMFHSYASKVKNLDSETKNYLRAVRAYCQFKSEPYMTFSFTEREQEKLRFEVINAQHWELVDSLKAMSNEIDTYNVETHTKDECMFDRLIDYQRELMLFGLI